jgi:hypothetical protein
MIFFGELVLGLDVTTKSVLGKTASGKELLGNNCATKTNGQRLNTPDE